MDELAAVCGDIEPVRVMRDIDNNSRAIQHGRGESNRRDETPRSLIVGRDVDSIRHLFEDLDFEVYNTRNTCALTRPVTSKRFNEAMRKFEAVNGNKIIVCAIQESAQTGNPCLGKYCATECLKCLGWSIFAFPVILGLLEWSF